MKKEGTKATNMDRGLARHQIKRILFGIPKTLDKFNISVSIYRENEKRCSMAEKLEKEFQYYLDHQDELVKEYDGKFIVIKAGKVIGTFDSELEAIQKTSVRYELGTFLVQKCESGSESYTATYHSRVAVA